MTLPTETVRAVRSTVVGTSGSASICFHSSSTSDCSTWAASSPCFPELPRKISAKRGEITTLKP